MKKIKLILLVLLISSSLSKTVVADTTDVYFANIVNQYDTLIFCKGDTVSLHGTGGYIIGFISPVDSTYSDIEIITIIGDSVHYYDVESGQNKISYTDMNGIWAYLGGPGYDKHATFFFTDPVTEPWVEENRSICGLRDTLYAGDGNYQDGVYFKWENITTGNIITEGYYPNDTSLILDYTADIKLTITGGCNEIVDTINMTLTTTILPNLGPDIVVCGPLFEEILLSLPETYDSYEWQDLSTDPTFIATTPGIYHVTVSNNCLTNKRDSIVITQVVYPGLGLGPDRIICDGTSTILDAGYDYDVIIWYTSSDTTDISHERYLTVDTDTAVFAFAGIIGCPSMMDDIIVTVINPYENNQVCIATVDTSGNNKVVWDRTFDVGIDFYNIYRLNDDYELIGSVNINEDPIFYDMGVDPMVSANRYKISAVDTCGNESGLSWYHGTIHITSAVATTGGVDITITDPYVEESGNYSPEKYYIYIDSLNDGNLTLIDSMNAVFNSYHINEPYSGATYRLGIGMPWNCEGNKIPSGSVALSNKTNATTSVNNLNKLDISIYPNPSTGIFQIRSDTQIEKIEIINTLGQVVLTVDDKKTIDLSDFNKGVYFANIKTTLGASIVKLILK